MSYLQPASQQALPSASQPASQTRKPTHRHLACLVALCTGGELFLTFTYDQHFWGARLGSECFKSYSSISFSVFPHVFQ
jgi:hypothetical protein